MSFARSILVKLAYSAIAMGIRIPRPANVRNYEQWSQLVDLLDRLEVNIVLDVGANKGFFSKHLRMAGYRGRIVSFEPIVEDCSLIEAMAKADPEWTVCRFALGDETGVKTFNVSHLADQTVYSSFLSTSLSHLKSHSIQTEVFRLDELLPKLTEGIDAPRVFLKMDTQGFDANVFAGAKHCLNMIVGLQSEVSVIPIYEGMVHYTEMLRIYEQAGFGLVDLFEVSRTADGRVVEYDCVMARQERHQV